MNPGVELRHLRYFLAVADELHFGRAAARLHIAQPALTQQIQRLETLLGTRLFDRTSRTVTLTPAGTVLRERAAALLGHAERDLAEVTRIGQGSQGTLHLGFVPSVLPLEPLRGVREFRARFPLVDVDLVEGFTSHLMERLATGTLDMAIVRDPDDQPGTVTVPLMTEPFMAIVPADHPLAERSSITGAELADNPLVFFPRAAGALAYEKNLSPLLESGRRPRVVQEATNWTIILYLVAAGLGVTIAPRSATFTAPASARILPLSGTDADTTIYLATRENEDRPLVHNLLELLPNQRTR
ncbi:LysR family transcriptional regulator [Nocardia seriolae]|uniref:HTH-type transcriptional regulator BenM n=1 Tax=Nocardia seriolae TaxID=37332 RepID=A0A0B8NMC0_9NOCA|nr:LysR substrate-binding domain-containing protein [Nocardia seriolae]APA96002.1 HTH-type transcriptional regulator BenM [Nocardia seriolae]MTJ65906.1 LysR family transcriptional regulator [Nocardia seriolae]MTJ75048.1 LysR family transcriptional regulator [Nocardia seriolae]MTJ86167.1 LysR family transcriptional regulator [Nocardia seriolae]MTK30163.1 LysR family transcriptional regulator [Nocardia seriolae]